MTAFAIITGVATLIGFFIQMSDFFPTHRELRKMFVVFLTGVFVGSSVAALMTTEVKVGGVESPVDVAVVLLIALTFLFFIVEGLRALLAQTDEDRESALARTGLGLGAVILSLVIGAMAFAGPTSNDRLSVDEVITLVQKHRRAAAYDRAIGLLQTAQRSLQKDDPRAATLGHLLAEVVREQGSYADRNEQVQPVGMRRRRSTGNARA